MATFLMPFFSMLVRRSSGIVRGAAFWVADARERRQTLPQTSEPGSWVSDTLYCSILGCRKNELPELGIVLLLAAVAASHPPSPPSCFVQVLCLQWSAG